MSAIDGKCKWIMNIEATLDHCEVSSRCQDDTIKIQTVKPGG